MSADVLSKLSETELKVACILHMLGGGDFGYGYCYWGHDSILSGEGNISNVADEVGGRKGLSKTLKNLRELGVVQFARGLMTEDGDVAGSGHAPAPEYEEALEAICESRGWL